MKKLIALSIVFGLIGCAAVPTPLPEPQSEGAKAYAARCGSCHSVPHPARLNLQQWRHMLTVMERRMAERRMASMTETEREAILDYLTAHARR